MGSDPPATSNAGEERREHRHETLAPPGQLHTNGNRPRELGPRLYNGRAQQGHGAEPWKRFSRSSSPTRRASYETIATMTGRDAAEVERVVKEAQDSGVIVRHRTMVNWEKLGRRDVWALIEVQIVPEREVGFDAVAERIYRFPEARSVYLVSGTYDLAVLVTAADIYEVSRFVSDKLATIAGVTDTVTHFLLKRYKEDYEVLVEQDEDRRQPMQP